MSTGSTSHFGFHLHTTLPLPSKVRQIDGLQVLRAVAVALVAWGHAGQELIPVTNRELPNFGVFGIDIFFVISGFIMSTIVLNNKTEPGVQTALAFTKRRLIRIYPIYWIFALLYAVRLLHSHQFFLQNYFPSFLLVPIPNYPRVLAYGWTLMFEIVFYMAVAAILLFTVRKAAAAVIAIFCVAVIIGAFVGGHQSVGAILLNPILLEFVFGAGIALAFHRWGARRPLGIALVCLGIALSFYLRAYPPHCALGMLDILEGRRIPLRIGTWGLTAAVLVGGTVFWSPTISTPVGKLAVVLGNASYSAYLASVLVIQFALRLLLKLHTGSPALSVGFEIGYQLILLVAVLGVGWASYQFVEWPMVRGLQSMSASKRARPEG